MGYRPLALAAGYSIAVRRATSVDIDQVRAILHASFENDFGYGYVPEWHWDVDRLQETYIDNARQPMFVAALSPTNSPDDPRVLDEPSAYDEDVIVGTAGLRIGGPTATAVPPEVAERYVDRQSVAQLVRVVSHPELRRTGVARGLVGAAVTFAREDAQFRTICLHTNALVPAAVSFWRSMGFTEVPDERTSPIAATPDSRLSTVHFELALRPS